MAALNYSDVSKLIKCDFATGELTWLERPLDMFPSKRMGNTWNSRYAGKPAMTAISNGYRSGSICGTLLKAHRVIWLLHTKNWPLGDIDHINGDPLDNRLENLRDVPHAINLRNQKLRSTNTSGINGVYFDKGNAKWAAASKKDGKFKFLGYFHSIDEAAAARRMFDTENGYHPNHGR